METPVSVLKCEDELRRRQVAGETHDDAIN
jgi:hypothetical protein